MRWSQRYISFLLTKNYAKNSSQITYFRWLLCLELRINLVTYFVQNEVLLKERG